MPQVDELRDSGQPCLCFPTSPTLPQRALWLLKLLDSKDQNSHLTGVCISSCVMTMTIPLACAHTEGLARWFSKGFFKCVVTMDAGAARDPSLGQPSSLLSGCSSQPPRHGYCPPACLHLCSLLSPIFLDVAWLLLFLPWNSGKKNSMFKKTGLLRCSVGKGTRTRTDDLHLIPRT